MKTKNKQKKINILKVGIIGLGASILAAFSWFAIVVLSGYQLGIVAIGVGYIIGLAVMFGANGKTGTNIQITSTLFALFAMIFAEYLISNHYVYQYVASQTIEQTVSYFYPLSIVFQVMINGLKEDPMTFLFWGIGIYFAFKVPSERNKQHNIKN